MTPAYDKLYLDDAMDTLGNMLDYAVNAMGYDAEAFYAQFVNSGIADLFGSGHPKYLAGMSGTELARAVILATEGGAPFPQPEFPLTHRRREYWAGWILAYYQWATGYRFAFIQRQGLDIRRILSLYHPLHEADVTKFTEVADKIIAENLAAQPSNLKTIRKARNMTQKELANVSGVSLRMIQLYEQRQQDISRAEARSVIALAGVLGCRPEDLLY